MNIRQTLSRMLYPEVFHLAERMERALEMKTQEIQDAESMCKELIIDTQDLQGKLTDSKEDARKSSIYLYEKIEALTHQRNEVIEKLRGWRKSYWDARELNKTLQEGIQEASNKIDELVAEITELKEENDRLREAGITLRNHVLQEEQTSAILKEHIVRNHVEAKKKNNNK